MSEEGCTSFKMTKQPNPFCRSAFIIVFYNKHIYKKENAAIFLVRWKHYREVITIMITTILHICKLKQFDWILYLSTGG